MVLRQLERALEELPLKSWSEVGGSVYLLSEKYSQEFRKLLKHLEGAELRRCEFKVEASPATL